MIKVVSLVCFSILSILVLGQNKVSGVVIDANTEKPIANAKVSVLKGQETKTNKSGKFSINLMSPDTVFFAADGYQMEYATLGDAKKVKVKLAKLEQNDVMVEDNFGSQKQRTLTSAVTVIERNNMNNGVANDIYELLRGRVPGLQILHGSANPTDKPTILLRGTAGLKVEEPLIVIDGIIGAPVSSIDPNDVANITVLRDGSATAMYGSRANSGVILIKSKKGSVGNKAK